MNQQSPIPPSAQIPLSQQIPNPYEQQNQPPIETDIRSSFLEDSYGADLNQLKPKSNSRHIRQLIATIILVTGIVTFVVLFYKAIIDVGVGGIVGICIAFYLFYLILSLTCNSLFAYLGNIQKGENYQSSYNRIRGLSGYFHFTVVCYHYETKFHTTIVTDIHGNSRRETHTTQQKVVTHKAQMKLQPRACTDESGNLGKVNSSTDIIFVNNRVKYRFKDKRSRQEFESQWTSFKNRHRKDEHQDYKENFVIPGLVSKVCFYAGQKPKNYRFLLIFWAFVGLVWPYSMYLESKISRFEIQYMKIVSL